MNIRINLLPPEARRQAWSTKRIMAAVAILTIIVLAGLYMYNLYLSWNLERQLAAARNQYELLRPAREKMLAANSVEQQIAAKQNILVGLTRERRSWYAVLTHFGTVMPDKVWLTELSLVEKGALRLKGMAAAYPDIATFMERFSRDELLGEPLLISAERDSALPATRFEMILRFKGL
ncbi:MAG: PilN domain-containing protein [Negativicutes bacterium]|nr:PilN domain-containing protein [Negativicutes bacterium]